MSQSVKAIKRKALKQGVQEYYDHYIVATEMYNLVLYDHHYEMMENALTYHVNIMNDLKQTFTFLHNSLNKLYLCIIEYILA